MQHFSDLKVWQRSHALVLEIYGATKSYPGDERFGLVSQLRRAADSVPANIAEGAKRETAPDYARFLNIAEARWRRPNTSSFSAATSATSRPTSTNRSNEKPPRSRGCSLRSGRRSPPTTAHEIR